MFNAKETCCTNCAHKDVCLCKERFLKAVEAIDEVVVNLPPVDGKTCTIRLHDIPWIKPVELVCSHYMSKTNSTTRSM